MRSDLAPLPPLRLLLIMLFAAAALVMVAVIQATHVPWLGLSFDAVGEDVRVAQNIGDHGIPSGARIEELGAGQLAIELRASDLIEEPDGFDSYAVMDEFFERQAQLRAALDAPDVTLRWRDAEDRPGSAMIAPQPRPLASLPFVFWFQLAAGIAGALIGAWVWSLRPVDWGVRMFALTGALFPVFTAPAAIYSSRELALAGDTFRLLSGINHFGALLWGAALCGIFLCYPRQLVRPRVLVALFGFAGLWWLADQARLAPDMDWGYRIPVMMETLGALVLACVQWRLARGRPDQRAALGWLALSALVGCGLFVFTTAGSDFLGYFPPLSQGYSFGFFLIMYVGIALGIGRFQLFNLGVWAYRILIWLGGALMILLLDGLLIAGFGFSESASLGGALVVGGLIYFPLRQWLWKRLANLGDTEAADVLPEIIAIAFQLTSAQREARLDALLQRLFSPLHLAQRAAPPNAAAPPAPTLRNHGLGLFLPACGGMAPRELEYAGNGRRLFSERDCELATAIGRLLDQAAAARDAYERGTQAERARIARDMHDDVGARLLTLIHRLGDSSDAELARAAMSDLRTSITTLHAAPISLADLMADLRNETRLRCEASAVAMTWQDQVAEPDASCLLDAATQAVLQKLLRETVTNALKHAQPTRLTLDWSVTRLDSVRHLNLKVTNDGATANPESWQEGRGLIGMRARLASCNGTMQQDWNAATNELQISLRIPLAPCSPAL